MYLVAVAVYLDLSLYLSLYLFIYLSNIYIYIYIYIYKRHYEVAPCPHSDINTTFDTGTQYVRFLFDWTKRGSIEPLIGLSFKSVQPAGTNAASASSALVTITHLADNSQLVDIIMRFELVIFVAMATDVDIARPVFSCCGANCQRCAKNASSRGSSRRQAGYVYR
jgi:hypothetical protein